MSANVKGIFHRTDAILALDRHEHVRTWDLKIRMAESAAIIVTGASRTFGQTKALNDVSLRVERGEMTALIGPSGSGKSTLLRALVGLVALDPGAGRVEALGQLVQTGGKVTSQARAVRSRIGFIFQKFNLVGRLTLFSNVLIGRLGRIGFWRGLFGLWSASDKSLAMSALQRVGIDEQAGQRAANLSGGQQQRGAIARALVQQAEIILADEPVASLDPASARRVMEALADINRQDGAAVVVTLHQIDIAMHYCRRIVALSAGQIVYDGPPEGLSPERLRAIYGEEYQDAAPSLLGAAVSA